MNSSASHGHRYSPEHKEQCLKFFLNRVDAGMDESESYLIAEEFFGPGETTIRRWVVDALVSYTGR